MSAENPILEFLDNDHDGCGLDACYCIKGQSREYGRVDVMDGGAVTARVLRAVNNHDKLLAALIECAAALGPARNDEERSALALACIAIASAKGGAA